MQMEGPSEKRCPQCKQVKPATSEFFRLLRGALTKHCLPCLEASKLSRIKGFCPHGKQKAKCALCGGSQICEHGRRKHDCVLCGGSSICIHKKLKSRCEICGGSQLCEHGKRKDVCPFCMGSQICEHKKQRQRCRECNGITFCEHGKFKHVCFLCGDPVVITIKKILNSTKASDIKKNRYDPIHFIDYEFVQKLITDCQNKCYYCKCEMQYTYLTKNKATIERLDNSIGHIKSNCVIACWNCNIGRVGQRPPKKQRLK